EVRPRRMVSEPAALPRADLLLEHDRLPGPAPPDPLPAERRPAAGPHAQRHGCDRSLAPSRARELPTRRRLCRGAGGPSRVRRAGRDQAELASGRNEQAATPLLEVAFGRVERQLACVQALFKALELRFAKVESAPASLDPAFEVCGLRLTRAEPLLGDRHPGAPLG